MDQKNRKKNQVKGCLTISSQFDLNNKLITLLKIHSHQLFGLILGLRHDLAGLRHTQAAYSYDLVGLRHSPAAYRHNLVSLRHTQAT